MDYNFREIEKKWQERWVKNQTYKVAEDKDKKKFYVTPAVRVCMWAIHSAISPVISMHASSACRASTC